MDSLITALSPEEEELAHKMLGRLHKIFSVNLDKQSNLDTLVIENLFFPSTSN